MLRAVNGGHAQSQPECESSEATARGSTSSEALHIHKAEAVAMDSVAGMCKNFHYSQPEPPSVNRHICSLLFCSQVVLPVPQFQNRSDTSWSHYFSGYRSMSFDLLIARNEDNITTCSPFRILILQCNFRFMRQQEIHVI